MFNDDDFSKFHNNASTLVRKNNKYNNYVVDANFSRTKRYVYSVSDLTLEEAKDEICHLMDLIQKMSANIDDFTNKTNKDLDKYGFQVI